jgi:lambda repressor-like predicted transcriptional regulator
MEKTFSYKELLEKGVQDAIRERLLTVNKKKGLSIPRMAKLIGVNQKTLHKFLAEEEEVVYAVISKILGWIEQEESQLNGQSKAQ